MKLAMPCSVAQDNGWPASESVGRRYLGSVRSVMHLSVFSLALSLTNAGIRHATDSMKWPGSSVSAARRLHKNLCFTQNKAEP